MRYILKLLLLFPSVIYAQQERYSKVEIKLSEGSTIQQVANLGVCVDHGIYHKNKSLITDLSQSEIQKLTEFGVGLNILEEDILTNLHGNFIATLPSCDVEETEDLIVPDNFEYGSMSGYYTYAEMLEQLDSMRSMYPNLITMRDSLPAVDTISTSHEGRPIWMVKVSNNADIDESEPEMIYTALHHAREPGSLTQTIFYLWYLLENYGNNEQVTAILNNTELYFVPCLNPDGYVYNESIQSNGGGMWRKNRRDNGDGTFGVDLNRNYAHQWGFDDQGSSPQTSSDTYRGPTPASEPEIQLITNFVDSHDFKFALNYHTYGGLLIYPWGYSDSFTPDSLEFSAFSGHMVSKNGYTAGTGTETVGYTVNGDSDDWYYGDTTHREPIYSMTPEAGSSFWPAQGEIIPFCNENLYPNLWTASYLLNYASAEFDYESEITTLNPVDLDIIIKRLGLKDSMNFIVGFQNYDLTEVNVIGGDTLSSMNHLDEIGTANTIQFQSSIQYGDTISMEYFVDNGYYKDIYPIQFIYTDTVQIGVSQYTDALTSTGLWTGNWGLDYIRFASAPSAMGDSPGTNYSNGTVSELLLDSVFDLSYINSASVNMNINFDIENDYDYVQLIAVSLTDNQEYPLCGLLTNSGTVNQDFEEPLYDGESNGWVSESVSLDELEGHQIKLKFKFVSDNFETGYGFNFDDFNVVIDYSNLGITDLESKIISITPNPTTGLVNLNIDNTSNTLVEVYNITGELVLKNHIENKQISLSNLSTGVYFLHVNDQQIKVIKL